ncbi:MAG: molybdopterin-dependent oxidoreductase [Caldilineaceae bacterium]|nr:molybdopterin-dependent oxidoreductase [Caldilineaceae bacterium]
MEPYDHDPLRPHRHDPNPEPPSAEAIFRVIWPGGERIYAPADLLSLPAVTIADCFIVSTGHGTSGPFTFTGVPLLTLIDHLLPAPILWNEVAVLSGDGFGVRLYRHELLALPSRRPALLAYAIDDRPLTRQQGLVRLIEPNETDDALRQVKWIAQIRIA